MGTGGLNMWSNVPYLESPTLICLFTMQLLLATMRLRAVVKHFRTTLVRQQAPSVARSWFSVHSCKAPYYCATSNNMKLVHWPLMGGLLRELVHLIGLQREGDWAKPQPAKAPPRCTKQHIHQQPVYQSLCCCIMVRCSAVLMCLLKG